MKHPNYWLNYVSFSTLLNRQQICGVSIVIAKTIDNDNNCNQNYLQ